MNINSPLPRIRHAVIAGANKCGTTSLFRYLAAHPAVRGSRIKETGFFLSNDAEQPDALEIYLQHFGPAAARGDAVLLEGTPHYLESGSRVARRIRNLLPDSRLIFLLRDPVDRFQSFYRSKQGFLDHKVSQLSSAAFVAQAFAEAALIEDTGQEDWRHAPYGRQLLKGRYAVYVRHFLEVFPSTSIRILYFEDLRDRPRETVAHACDFLNLDPAMYDEFEFVVENRSRRHRFPLLRTLASRANHRLEPTLNRIPWLRHIARAAYNAINASPPDSSLTFAPADATRLRTFYGPFNRDLAQLATQLQLAHRMPNWPGGD